MEKEGSPVPALDKMDLIFDLLASSPEGLCQATICSKLKLPKATVSRMLGRLSDLGYLEHRSDGLYSLGAKLLTLGNLVNRRLDIAAVATPYLKKLSRDIDEMVKLSIMRGDTIYPLRSFESTHAIRITLDSGTVYPPYIGAAGKLLLALTEEGRLYREKVLPSLGLTALTSHTVTDYNELEAILKKIEKEKTAYDMQEESDGIYAMAMPVYGSEGKVLAAVSVPFFGDYTVKMKKYRPLLEQCAAAISRSMGYKKDYRRVQEDE